MPRWIFLCGLFISSITYSQVFDIPPESVGGKRETKRIFENAFCADSIPAEFRERGKVAIAFIIYDNLIIDSLTFGQGVNEYVNKEIARVFPLIQWLPGIIGEEPVSAWHLFEFKVTKKFYENNDLCFADIDDRVFQYGRAEIQAQFLGTDFSEFVYSNLTYPPAALRNNIEGTVKVRFVIEENGRVSNVGIKKSVGAGCDEEAKRVILKSRWTPATIRGMPVRMQMEYPITFKLNDESIKAIPGGDMMER